MGLGPLDRVGPGDYKPLKADDRKGCWRPPLPLTSLADDVAALNRSLDRTEGPIVLAGHAYAGAVARPERVKALVYVTALAPDEGEKVADVFYRLEPHPQAPKLAPDSNGLIWLPETAFATSFAQNASAEDRTVLAAVQRPISLDCITVPVGRPLWRMFRAGFWLPKTTT
jgi:pimeloyl-ACP methyl ester carboxylesterase